MENTKFYTCKKDRAFKEVFMKEENKDLLIPLLELCLGIKIHELEYLNLEDNVDNVKVKRKSYDLRVSTDIGRIQIEINANIYDYSRMRQFSYLSNEYSHLVEIGEDYDEKIEVIQINFTYGMMSNFQEKYQYLFDDKDYRIYEIKDKDGKNFVKNFKIYEFNMDYYMKFWYDKNKEMIEKYKFIIMMNLGLSDLEKISKKDKVVGKYMEEIERVNKDPKFIEYMSDEEDQRKRINTMMKRATEDGITLGREEGITLGREEGILQEKRDSAKKMLEEKIDISMISKITGLSEEEIISLSR